MVLNETFSANPDAVLVRIGRGGYGQIYKKYKYVPIQELESSRNVPMEALVDEIVVSPEELVQYRTDYETAVREGKPAENLRFAYVWALVCSPDQKNISEGIQHLKDMLKPSKSQDETRTYLFYITVASAKLKNYQDALHSLELLQRIAPENSQINQLEVLIRRLMKRDGAIGAAAVVGGAAMVGLAGVVAVGAGIAGLGMIAAKKVFQ